MADPTMSGLATFVRAHVRPGMNVIDIGANVGDVTAIAAEAVGPSGRVIAYEPSPLTALALQARFRQHSQVDLRAVAIADRVEHAAFYVDPSKSTSSTLYSGAIGPDRAAVDVPVTTLDNELPLLPAIDLIKVDAQGAEARIFEAARRLLKRDKPLLVFEVWPDGLRAAGNDATVLLDRLAGLSYHFHPLNAKGRLGHPGKIRALIAGQTRSKAMNVVAHPRRWPARRWQPVLTATSCVIPRRYRWLCQPWTTMVE
jgi:FkbM family methyltransferase